MMGPEWGHAWGGMGYGGLFMLVFWVLVIAGVLVLLRRLRTRDLNPPDTSPQQSALEIVQQRYARGEISREEYEQVRRDLQA